MHSIPALSSPRVRVLKQEICLSCDSDEVLEKGLHSARFGDQQVMQHMQHVVLHAPGRQLVGLFGAAGICI